MGRPELGHSIEWISGEESSMAGRNEFDQHQMEVSRAGCESEPPPPNVAKGVCNGDLNRVQGPGPHFPFWSLNGEGRVELAG